MGPKFSLLEDQYEVSRRPEKKKQKIQINKQTKTKNKETPPEKKKNVSK